MRLRDVFFALGIAHAVVLLATALLLADLVMLPAMAQRRRFRCTRCYAVALRVAIRRLRDDDGESHHA